MTLEHVIGLAGVVAIVIAVIRRRRRRGSWSINLSVHRDRDDTGI